MKLEYEANDIQTLSFKDAVRSMPHIYLGNDGKGGALQTVREIISNSIDEWSQGYGKEIIVGLSTDNKEVTVSDNGRGLPFGIREDGTEAMEAIYLSPYSGGKYNGENYHRTIGSHGLGGKTAALTALNFQVNSWRKEEEAVLVVFKGEKVSFNTFKTNKKDSGTIVKWRPDQDVFHIDDIVFNLDEIKSMCQTWAYVCKGLIFTIIQDDNKISFCYENGILDYLRDTVQKQITPNYFYSKKQFGTTDVELAFVWTTASESTNLFVNGLEIINGGTPTTGYKTAITRNINKILNTSLSGEIIRRGVKCVISITMDKPSWSDQTKNKVNNQELRGYTDKTTVEALDNFSTLYPEDFKSIIKMIQKINKAEEAADKAREAVLNHTREIHELSTKKVILPTKLKDAEFLGEESTLLVVEGKSAAGSMAVARDTTKYGIFEIRGKMINCLTHDIEDILANEEVKGLLVALGVEYGKPYNAKKLRYGKIAICSDSDVDGGHIGCLIMAFIYKMIPKFLEENRLCWLRAPIYKKTIGKKDQFYYTDEAYIKDTSKGGNVIKFKGLGQMSKQDTALSMFNKEHLLETLTYNVDDSDILQNLMGDDVEPKKDFVFSNIDFSKIEV